MTTDFSPDWFSAPQPTIEAAQALYQYKLFNPAGVFRTPGGEYVMGLIRDRHNWPLHETARNIQRLTGYEMVSCADPLFGVWKPYESEAPNG